MKRNIIVILCDQLRPDFLPVYGGKAIDTPHLDALAKEGVTYDRAITVSPVCAPARASMMTGRFVSDHGVWTNDYPFRDGMEYLAERMNSLGYATGAFGKLHHFPARDAKGFQTVFQMEENRLGEEDDYLVWLKKRRGENVKNIFNHKDRQFDFDPEEYYENWIADRAMDFIGENRKAPFLAWVSFQGPHGPFDPPSNVKGQVREKLIPEPVDISDGDNRKLPETVQYRQVHLYPRDGENIRKDRIAYCEMIIEIDRQIGRLIAFLKEKGLYENTTIFFSADHGDEMGSHRFYGKGPMPYPAQLMIPLILANQPGLERGSRSGALTGNLDIPGTVLDIAGDDRPLGYSRSLLGPMDRKVNYSEFCDSARLLDDGRYLYAYYPFESRSELYDTNSDPDCLSNLAGRPEQAARERDFLKHALDFGIIAKGVRVEAQDMVPDKQKGLNAKYPAWKEDFEVYFPISANYRKHAGQAGLDRDYLEILKDKPVKRYYATPYWMEDDALTD